MIPELEMTGVEIMNDDPYLTEVLYAKIIDQDEILQRKFYSPASPAHQ